MSHLRDLQRLRNTRNNFQIKRNINQHPAELRLNEASKSRKSNHYNEMVVLPQFVMPKLIELDHETSTDPYSKFLQSKELLTARDSRDRQEQSKNSQRLRLHKRGSSFGVAGTYFDKKSRELPQSGMTVYNFTLRLGSNQVATSQTSQLNRKNIQNPSRTTKVPELFMSKDISNSIKQSKEIRNKKERHEDQM